MAITPLHLLLEPFGGITSVTDANVRPVVQWLQTLALYSVIIFTFDVMVKPPLFGLRPSSVKAKCTL